MGGKGSGRKMEDKMPKTAEQFKQQFEELEFSTPPLAAQVLVAILERLELMDERALCSNCIKIIAEQSKQ